VGHLQCILLFWNTKTLTSTHYEYKLLNYKFKSSAKLVKKPMEMQNPKLTVILVKYDYKITRKKCCT